MQDVNWPDNVATGALLLTVDPPVFVVAVPASTGRRPSDSRYTVIATRSGQRRNGRPGQSRQARCHPASAFTLPRASSQECRRHRAHSRRSSRLRIRGTRRDSSSAPIVGERGAAAARGGDRRAVLRQREARSMQATLAATGGTGLTTWTLSAGALPAGLTLGANGAINGTPTAVGAFPFTVAAADAGWAGNVATRALSITVGAREIVLYAADATRVAGTWSLVSDARPQAGRASGIRMPPPRSSRWRSRARRTISSSPSRPKPASPITCGCAARPTTTRGRTTPSTSSSPAQSTPAARRSTGSARPALRRSASKTARTPAWLAGAGRTIPTAGSRARCTSRPAVRRPFASRCVKTGCRSTRSCSAPAGSRRLRRARRRTTRPILAR